MQVFGEDAQSMALFALACHQFFEPGLPYPATSVEESFSCHSLAESSREDWQIKWPALTKAGLRRCKRAKCGRALPGFE